MRPERLAEIEARLDSVPACPLYRAKNGGKAHPKGTQVWMNDHGDGRFVADTNCTHGDYAAVFANAVADLTDLVGEVHRLNAKLAAYTDLPPEPDTAMGAFMAVLAVDNDPEEPDNYAGDCDAEATTWPDDARWRPLQRLTAWTSLPEIPEHYETVEVKLNDDARIFAWRDDGGGWHTEGRPGIVDADVVGWRRVIP